LVTQVTLRLYWKLRDDSFIFLLMIDDKKVV